MRLTTHVLDTARGAPAVGIPLALYAIDGDERRLIARTRTNDDGRTDAPLGIDVVPGIYEIVFSVAGYFKALKTPALYDDITVRICVAPEPRDYHVPLLLAPWSYATYRGS